MHRISLLPLANIDMYQISNAYGYFDQPETIQKNNQNKTLYENAS